MRHPNGYGSVVKLSGNRRRPFCARKTQGFNLKGHPIYKVIGYYETRKAGLIALAEYNKNPYDIDGKNITFAELYEKFKEMQFPKYAENTTKGFVSSFRKLKHIHNMKYIDLTAFKMQEVVDSIKGSAGAKQSVKSLFHNLDTLALKMEVISKRNSDLIEVGQYVNKTQKRALTNDEINQLWERVNENWIDSILILLYTGMRKMEMLILKKENVDLEEQIITCGIKTASGKNRIIPIHPRILPFIKKRMTSDSEYLFHKETKKGVSLSANDYSYIVRTLNLNFTPHECRHTFRSLLDSLNANKVCIDLLMGHKSQDVGERIYTHKTIEELRVTINLLP